MGKPLVILCGTKMDLNFKREITYLEGNELAKSKDMIFFESSAKNNINIKEIFEVVAEQKINQTVFLSNDAYDKSELRHRSTVQLNPSSGTSSKNSCC